MQAILSSTTLASRLSVVPARCVHVSACVRGPQAARYKVTIKHNKPLTYEQAMPPYEIGVSKSWNSWNTANLLDGIRKSETATEDFFIRKFMHGTWHRLFLSELIIKRRGNMIVVGGIVLQAIHPRKLYFLIGYTEEMLSYILKCPIKIEVQTIADKRQMIFKHV